MAKPNVSALQYRIQTLELENADLRAQLATVRELADSRGLEIATLVDKLQAAQPCTAAERAVLDAAAALAVDNLVQIAGRNGRRMARFARAELARRNTPRGGGQ